MVPSIARQSIEIRLRFDLVPKITASVEVCMVSGMLCKTGNVPLPVLSDTDSLKEYAISVPITSETAAKLHDLLIQCQKENEPITDDLAQVVHYGYDHPL